MYICMLPVLLATMTPAQPDPKLPPLVELKQAEARPHPKLTLPRGHAVGPTIPGLTKGQGAVPQGLAFWEKQKWFLISCYFHEEGHPSVVVAIDAATGKLVRCLTLVEAGGKAHSGHVGGLAVSDKYLWIGSGQLYRVPLTVIAATKAIDHLHLEPPVQTECTASFAAYYDQRVWVGEFVSVEDNVKGNPDHYTKDRNGTKKYAWAAGYALDANEDLAGAAGGNRPAPAAVLSIREHVQGLAFLGDHIILSTSFGRKENSILAAYTNPFPGEGNKPHEMVKVKGGDAKVPLWFLDGKNKVGNEIEYPPMSEGITAYGKRLAVICESGAEVYQKDGHGPLDSIIVIDPPGGK